MKPSFTNRISLQFHFIKLSQGFCLIKSEKSKGSGFFLFGRHEGKIKKYLFTSSEIITQNDISKSNKITLTVITCNNGKITKATKEIQLDKSKRFIWISSDKEIDVTVVEILESDNIANALEVDNAYVSPTIDYYKDKEILMFHCSSSKDVTFSLGKVLNEKFEHNIKADELSIGGPIISLGTFKLIGLQSSKKNAKENAVKYNNGIFMFDLISKIPEITWTNIFPKNKFIINYNIEENNKEIILIDDSFCKTNKDSFLMVIEGKEYQFKSTHKFQTKGEKEIQIINKNINKSTPVNELTNMFLSCKSLISFQPSSKFDTSTITTMNSMFRCCTSLSILPDISSWNTSNVENTSAMFYECRSLVSLPDISNWNTDKFQDIWSMFSRCESLTSVPDISKWNIKNVKDIGGLFYSCKSLTSLPDLSKWDTGNVENVENIFSGCIKLTSLPDLSKWNTGKIENMCGLFYQCSNLKTLPDISGWKTENVKEMEYMFAYCDELTVLPDIGKWDTIKVENMKFMFHSCGKLKALPDISRWKTGKVKYMQNMFDYCSKLGDLPNIFDWDLGKVEDKINMFVNCVELSDDIKEKIKNKFGEQLFK